MTTYRIEPTVIGLVGIAIVLATGIAASADTTNIISPSTAKNVDGDDFRIPNPTPLRIQFLFPATDFAELPEANRLLVGYNFRGDKQQTVPREWTSPNEQVWISTTPLTTLTTVFDNNHGPDKILVHDGSVSFNILPASEPNGLNEFADATPFQTPFHYDPSQGNLLIERIVFDPSIPVPSPAIDVQTTTVGSVLINDSLWAREHSGHAD